MTAIGLFGRGSLYRSLARGADPNASGRRGRRSLAEGIRNLVEEVEAPSPGHTAAAPPQRRDIPREPGLPLAPAADPAGDDEVSPHGVALYLG